MELGFFPALKTFFIPYLRICGAVIVVDEMPVLASGTKKTGSPSFLTTGKSNGYFYVKNNLIFVLFNIDATSKINLNKLTNCKISLFFPLKITVFNVASPFYSLKICPNWLTASR